MKAAAGRAHREKSGVARNSGFIGACLLALAALAQAAPPGAAMLANACGGCHGTGGASAGPAMPSLAGQPQAYFAAAMKQYRSGERPSTVMGRLAQGYSDAQIDAMAAYFAAQKPVRQNGPADARLAEQGRAVFYKQCKYCHLDGQLWSQFHRYREFDRQCGHCHADYGDEAKGDTPAIAGQWPRYLEIQLDEFKRGARKMSQRKAQKLNALSREDMEAVAHFYASQAPD